MKKVLMTIFILNCISFANAGVIDPNVCDLTLPESDLYSSEIAHINMKVNSEDIDYGTCTESSSGIPACRPHNWFVEKYCTNEQNRLLAVGRVCSCEFQNYTSINQGYGADGAMTFPVIFKCKKEEPLPNEKINEVLCQKLVRCQTKLPLTSTIDNYESRLKMIVETKDLLSCNK